jgi:uncharacterized membrane protein (DUF485 family)
VLRNKKIDQFINFISLIILIIYIFLDWLRGFCLKFFGLKSQTRGHVMHMSLNEPFGANWFVIIVRIAIAIN